MLNPRFKYDPDLMQIEHPLWDHDDENFLEALMSALQKKFKWAFTPAFAFVEYDGTISFLIFDRTRPDMLRVDRWKTDVEKLVEFCEAFEAGYFASEQKKNN